MKLINSIIILCLLSVFLYSTEVKVITFKEFQQISNQDNDTTYLFNFMATWCVPCVREIPHFERFYNDYKSEKIKIVYISLDFRKDLDSRLIPFIKKNNINSTVYLLNEPDYNSWIDKVDESWSGAIPATLVVNNKKNIRDFIEKELTYDDLENLIIK